MDRTDGVEQISGEQGDFRIRPANLSKTFAQVLNLESVLMNLGYQ
jgi:hypothetical protein